MEDVRGVEGRKGDSEKRDFSKEESAWYNVEWKHVNGSIPPHKILLFSCICIYYLSLKRGAISHMLLNLVKTFQ